MKTVSNYSCMQSSQKSMTAISNTFEGGSSSIDSDPVLGSRSKLHGAMASLRPWCVPKIRPCQTLDECFSYRSRCNFQLIHTLPEGNDQSSVKISPQVSHAIRKNHEPVIIDDFPIASSRVQRAMKSTLQVLNELHHDEPLRCRLTSVSYAASWSDLESSDCIVTLHYDRPVDASTKTWREQAQLLCSRAGFKQVIGRSRKRMLRAFPDIQGTILFDSIWLAPQADNSWSVSLQKNDSEGAGMLEVKYEKPEAAFFHPNAKVMCQALEWILERVSTICSELEPKSPPRERRHRMLELYCGCGAHTMALAVTGLLDTIVAVEMDDRLIQACRRNDEINREQHLKEDQLHADIPMMSPLTIVSDDAGMWAKVNTARGTTNNDSTDDENNIAPASTFDILLVDPPKQGLDANVCQMAIKATFEHIIYISCGRDALVRDLTNLQERFEVVDCYLVDLFPGTDAVESLVHLRRK